MDKLSIGDKISAGITVRGYSGAHARALADPHLDEWQGQHIDRLPDGGHFDASDNVSAPVSSQQVVTRTLTVIADAIEEEEPD